MSSSPKVSVLVPVYNVEEYLRECLDSLTGQSLDDIEFICINDGSKDSSPKILREYATKDKRIRVIDKPNSGYGASMNLGLRTALGKYIGILEADDYADPNMFKELLELAEKHECDMVKSNYYLWYATQDKLDTCKVIRSDKTRGIVSVSTCPEMISYPASIWSGLYRREFLFASGINFLETPGASYQDISFYLKCVLSAQKVVLTDKAYVHYRQDNQGSSSNNRTGKIFCVTDEYREVLRYLSDHSDFKKYTSLVYAQQYNAYLWNLTRLAPSVSTGFLHVFSKTFLGYWANDELDQIFFAKVDPRKITLLIKKPEKFYRKYISKKKY